MEINMKFRVLIIRSLVIICNLALGVGNLTAYAQGVKQPNVAGDFYPKEAEGLSLMVDDFLSRAQPEPMNGKIFALISPHAGYGFSGQVAAYGYKLVKDKPYKTVIVIGPSHHFNFSKAAVYAKGFFCTPLGYVEVDSDFTKKLLYQDEDIISEPHAFDKEHSVEVQLPFLQKVLPGCKIVPILMGDCTLPTCEKLAALLKEAIGKRTDVLVIASSDMYHGYDYEEAEIVDNLSLSYLKKMDPQALYYALREGKAQFCGGFPIVTTLILAKELGHNKINVLKYTNSAEVTANKTKGTWTVGYSSSVIDQPEGESAMLNQEQRKKLLKIARSSIEMYLKTGKKLEVKESDIQFNENMGAFVTLHKHEELRGCIGNLIGSQPLYLVIRDMAVESAVGDPRFPEVKLDELKDIEIEISALSPLKRVNSIDEIELGKHGVLIRRGSSSGVFLPQVATETGWSKEEFLANLCAHKAGLASDCWKDKNTELYVFTAEVFSEKNY